MTKMGVRDKIRDKESDFLFICLGDVLDSLAICFFFSDLDSGSISENFFLIKKKLQISFQIFFFKKN
jgi:hypothetical protein